MKARSLLFIFLAFSAYINAQSNFSLGVKSGYNHSWQDYGDTVLPDDAVVTVHGYKISALAYFRLHKNFSIGIEPGLARKGAACIPGFVIFEGDTKFHLNYMEAPILFKGHITILNDIIEVFGNFGLVPSYLVYGKRVDTIYQGDGVRVTESRLDLTSSVFNRYDVGYQGGVGFVLNLNRNNIFVESTFYNGFIDFDSINTSKNRAIFVGLGYLRDI